MKRKATTPHRKPRRAARRSAAPAPPQLPPELVAEINAITKAVTGRPRIITPAVVMAVGMRMAEGVTEEHACSLEGVKASTFHTAVWASPLLREILTFYHAKFAQNAVRRIALGSDWTGLAWILERRYGQSYKKVEVLQQEHTGELTLSATQMTELRRLAQKHFVPASPAHPTQKIK